MATNEIVAVKIIKLEPGEELDEVLNEVNFLCDFCKTCANQIDSTQWPFFLDLGLYSTWSCWELMPLLF